MKNIILLIFFCLITTSLISQNFYEERRDTSFVKDGFSVSLISITDSAAIESIWQIPERNYQNPIITDVDSIRDILKKNIVYMTYKWAESPIYDINGVICNNGFKIFLDIAPYQPRYYPVEGILSLGSYSSRTSCTFYLSDGALTYAPESMYFSSDKMFRWGGLDECYRQKDCVYYYYVLDAYDMKSNEYRRILNLADVLPFPTYISDVRWIDDTYYFYDENDETWQVKVEPLKN